MKEQENREAIETAKGTILKMLENDFSLALGWLSPILHAPDIGEVRELCKEIRKDLELLELDPASLIRWHGRIRTFAEAKIKGKEKIEKEFRRLAREVLRIIVTQSRSRELA
ncbi:MAG: hypothetical protein PHS27_02355 [Candidatus Pacebacteria bacterium]|nr:hypothetical protein [Candidatus Paceibacterota bacterium]